ncbi:hypothetical protein [Rubrivirga sp.]|uniref:hypothetical protein n=1 Tax=Rubrivirga sp. TaxID=1885344 RepID=UPI003C71D57B
MRLIAVALVVLSSGCTAQAPAEPATTDGPLLDAPYLEPGGPGDDALDLEALSLVERIRLLAPFVGGPLEDAEAAIGGPVAVAHTVEGPSGPATGVSTSGSRHFVYGDTPSVLVLEAENGRLVRAMVVQEDVDALQIIYDLEGEMQAWLGDLEYENVDHGYYFWEKEGWTFTGQAADVSRLELIVEER